MYGMPQAISTNLETCVMSIYTNDNAGLWQQEVDLFCISRIGIQQVAVNLSNPEPENIITVGEITGKAHIFERGNRFFELSNHLGNVLVTVSDRRRSTPNTGNPALVSRYQAVVLSAQDYFAFGMIMPGRNFQATAYRYGFNGKENDNEVKGSGNQQDYGMRIYDPRIGRFLSVDPLTAKFPYYTPYQFSGNSPIKFIDLDGLEPAEPDQIEYKGKTGGIDMAYQKTGGDEKYFEKNSKTSLGGYLRVLDKNSFFGNNKNRSDNVNKTSQFLLNEDAFSNEKELVNYLLGNFIWGGGPENIVFPENGKYSLSMKGSIMVGESLLKWAKNNYKDGIYKWQMDLRGKINVDVRSGIFSLEHFLGSAYTRISHINAEEIKIEIYNITSFGSGNITKDIPIVKWFVDKPLSTRRMDGSTNHPTYSNTSQYFSITISTSEADKLIQQFSGGTKSGPK